jgi:hypothetical protein
MSDKFKDGLEYQYRLMTALMGEPRIYASYKEMAEAAEKLRLDASGHYIKGGEESHWEGCEETHYDCKIAKLEKENTQLREDLQDARDIINHGVELMPLEQLGQWEGVRAWLELAGGEK